jgi:hypothetical protein
VAISLAPFTITGNWMQWIFSVINYTSLEVIKSWFYPGSLIGNPDKYLSTGAVFSQKY